MSANRNISVYIKKNTGAMCKIQQYTPYNNRCCRYSFLWRAYGQPAVYDIVVAVVGIIRTTIDEDPY